MDNIGVWSPNSDGITIDTTKPQMTGATARDWDSVDITLSGPDIGADVALNYTCTGGLQIL